MAAIRLNGTLCATAIRGELTPRVAVFASAHGRAPPLHILLVGDDPASKVYGGAKEKAGIETRLKVTVHRMPSTSTRDEVLAQVRALNADASCDGILVQAPLPAALGKAATQEVFDAIDPAKDVDGFHPVNVGMLVQGRAVLQPCTPTGVIELLERSKIAIAGTRSVVIGRSEIVGKPMALLLLQRDSTVTICHSRTKNLPELTRDADILVSAIGRPGYVTADMVKPGATVIDVGISPTSDRQLVVKMFGEGSERLVNFDKRGSTVVGDVHPGVWDVAGAMTPVPGGVGPLTIALLLKNTLVAAESRAAR
jgi:methylenetetrahydrofolate dehydrogenase (NADP+) / methenyltetrahydrofolate cyclohydrolase